ncbi:EAL domain-containing protein (putative c-di-GMP-specific phosphodiesterase class I) [Salsuginibacillus halophilus]|uniref:EAL domain-containing protein (Putative c-di-GMP-specific phosphodiesterase class I) n=1 Tax=Salsuginibacillus halophilus TaxID=517424 RepID=A0A2P8HYN9_9BACI|nr:EAL domain-containing protein [Salsuginibacillus halophilus]PSL51336.1 EAL domain-containing protein (putative c-di-GMP-specific phosphodiesterase class I) [Salsuginibacillus halophilus]
MDALEIVMNQTHLVPYYQPVVSADRQEIAGYEMFGRYITKASETVSLAPFFLDPEVPEDYQIEVDECLQERAFSDWINEGSGLLFLNIGAHMYATDRGEQLIARILAWEKEGLDRKKLVFDIPEHAIASDKHRVTSFIQYVKSLGIQVAIDDVRMGGGDLEAIAAAKPNIIKIDAAATKDDEILKNVFAEANAMRMLSRKLGAVLLVERLSSFHDLYAAWMQGGRYYQGYYIDKPKKDFQAKDQYKMKLQKDYYYFLDYEKKKIEAQIQLRELLNERLQPLIKNFKRDSSFDDFILNMGRELGELAFRIYICDEKGFQRSANALFKNGEWSAYPEDEEVNWSWRPYFLENIMRMAVEKQGILSDLYTDIHTNERIRTYAVQLHEEAYIFIDLPYKVLFQRDYLL